MTTTTERLFIGKFPAGLSYADTQREEHGDYVQVAFMSYVTLKLEIRPNCPPELINRIRRHAATVQAKRGQEYQVSTCGQTVRLGRE